MEAALVVVICGQRGGPSRHRYATVPSTSYAEALSGNYRHLIITNWCIPSGDKVANDGDSTPVERAKDLIAFSYLVLVSFV
jgi:hypothetical protein